MIRAPMERTARSGERREYASAVAGLWERLGSALTRLERIAEGSPEAIGGEILEELPTLQYSLHAGAELALGIQPPRGAERAHAELVDALEQARDASAQVAYALQSGDDELVARLLPEWRGALFRVRFARLRALEQFSLARSPGERRSEEVRKPERSESGLSRVTSIAATLLVIAGALLFTAGAVAAAWPIWAAGLALFAGGFVLFRP